MIGPWGYPERFYPGLLSDEGEREERNQSTAAKIPGWLT